MSSFGVIVKTSHPTYNCNMGENRKYKDSVFTFLFSDPDLLRELYCALENVTLPPDIPVTINTLRDVLFLNRINDISFEIGGKLVILLEHQSTINPNMALRLLMYIARVYEKILGDKNMYTTRLLLLPRPEFFVLYNGVSPYPDQRIIKLSDAFEEGRSLGLPEKERPALELEVKVININQGKNDALVRRCKTLAAYSAFIAKVREFGEKYEDKTEAMKQAVKYCRNHDILKEFLETNATEVINMLMTEFNLEDALAVHYREGREDGREKGLEEGREEGREEKAESIARNALAEGVSIELVQKITGLDLETIESFVAK